MRKRTIGLVLALALSAVASKCDSGDTPLSGTGPRDFTVTSVTLSGPETISNGMGATYSAAVTISRNAGNSRSITGTLDLTASTEDKGLIKGFQGNLGTVSVTFPPSAVTATSTFTLSCAAERLGGVSGPGNTLRGGGTDSGHGGRVVITNPPCPPGCGKTPVNPCPPGCGGTTNHDDPVTIAAIFRDEFARETRSSTATVLCVP
jgi:hypothetical protein